MSAGSDFPLPGLPTINVIKFPVKRHRKGITPFTKEELWLAEKPATVKIKGRSLKKLKDFAAEGVMAFNPFHRRCP